MPGNGGLNNNKIPSVISSSVEHGSVNVDPVKHVVIEFSENVFSPYCEMGMPGITYGKVDCEVNGNKIIISNPYPKDDAFKHLVLAPNSTVFISVFTKDSDGNKVSYFSTFNTGKWQPRREFNASKCTIPDTSVGLVPIFMLPEECELDVGEIIYFPFSSLNEKNWMGNPIDPTIQKKIQADNPYVFVRKVSEATGDTIIGLIKPLAPIGSGFVSNVFNVGPLDSIFVFGGAVRGYSNKHSCGIFNAYQSVGAGSYRAEYQLHTGANNSCY